MPKLRNRQMQIPGGYRFELKPLKWRSPAYASFDTIVNQVQALINSNPKVAQANKWPNDRIGIENWVDSFNAQICKNNGWNQYIHPDAQPPPKSVAPEFKERLRRVAGAVKAVNDGARILLDWERSGDPPVESETAMRRATVCVTCPQNQSGGLTAWFTVPASELIRRKLARLHDLNLKTPLDEKLHVCAACYCPLRLKMHTPMRYIRPMLTNELKSKLPAHCWMLKEK